MLFDGALFGILSWASMMVSWTHLPTWLRKFTINHPLFTEIVSTLVTWLTITAITHSLTGVIASVVCCLLLELTMTLLRWNMLPFLAVE